MPIAFVIIISPLSMPFDVSVCVCRHLESPKIFFHYFLIEGLLKHEMCTSSFYPDGLKHVVDIIILN